MIEKKYTKELFLKLPTERQDEILATIVKVMAEEGVRGCSVRKIAARLGMSHGSLFHYFPSKEAMVHAVIGSGNFTQEMVINKAVEEEEGALDKLFCLLDLTFDFAYDHPDWVAFWRDLTLPVNQNFSIWLEEIEMEGINLVRKIIEKGILTGEFSEDLCLDGTVYLVDSLLAQILKSVSSPIEIKKLEYHFKETEKERILGEVKKTLAFVFKKEGS